MATATTEKKVVKKTAPAAKAPVKKAAEVKEPVEKKERAPKVEPKFSVEDLWDTGRDFAKAASTGLKDFKEALAERMVEIEADPKTYRDHVAAAKYLVRRADRMLLSLAELEQGLKERKPRDPKPVTERKTRAPKAAEVEPDEDEEEDDEVLVDDEDEDDDEDDTDLDDLD